MGTLKDKKLLYERKVSPTLGNLLKNAHKVLGRGHKTDRSVKIKTITPSPGVKSLMVSADIKGEVDTYKTTIIFYDVEYGKSKSKQFDSKIEDPKIGTVYYSKPKIGGTQTRVNCTCKWFQFACEWYLKPENGLTPRRNPRPYKRIDGQPPGTIPSPNPEQIPCVCKHIYQLALKLKDSNMIKEEANMKLRLAKKELGGIVSETIYEMLQENDENLIKLMMTVERAHGDIDENINEWVEKTTAILQEQLGIDPGEKPTNLITEEKNRMRHLANIKTEDT